MNLLAAGLLALLIVAPSPSAGLTLEDISRGTIAQESGMCGSHIVTRLHVQIGPSKYFVFVSPDTDRILMLNLTNPDDESAGGSLVTGTVGKGGKITVVETHIFEPEGRDSGGPCPQMYPSKA